jgi:hypothetical protein
MTIARDRGHSAAQACADKADRLCPGWTDAAVDAIRRFASRQNGCWTIEQVREVIGEELPEPENLRAWGSVTRVAVRRGFIARVPGAFAPASSSNGSEKPLYTKGEGA